MTACSADTRTGGLFRVDWGDGKGNGFTITGAYLEVTPCSRIRNTERMFVPDPLPETLVATRFDPAGSGTLLTMRMTFPTPEALAAAVSSGAEQGMDASFTRLEEILAEG